MAKHYDKRITEALATLWNECTTVQMKSTYFAVLEWLQALANRSQERTVGTDISLNTHFSFTRADRQRLRACFLVQRTVGGWDSRRTALEKARFLGLSSAHFPAYVTEALRRVLIRRDLANSVVMGVTLTASVHYSDAWQGTIKTAAYRAQRLMEKTRAMLNANSSRAIYVRWFGEYDATRYAAITTMFQQMSDAMNTNGLTLDYAEGNGFGSTLRSSWVAGAIPRVTLESKFFTAARINPEGRVYDPATYDRALIEYNRKTQELAEARAGADNQSLLDRQRQGFAARIVTIEADRTAIRTQYGDYAAPSYAGVIVHELAHCVGGSTDVVYRGLTAYGSNLAMLLARDLPAQAINNADNIRLFAEEFLENL